MAQHKKDQWSLCKNLLSLFIGMALGGCAGTDTSVPKNEDDNPNLFKVGTPIAGILVSRMPEFASSLFKGALDSVPGEYYIYATNSRVDSLLKKEKGQYRTIVSIAYDSLDGLNSFELQKGDKRYSVEKGILVAEYELPKYYKEYWNNGKIKKVETGNFHIDDESVFLDSGHSEHYFETGKIKELNDWKDGKLVASKQWNEDGVMVVELDFPKYVKFYWNNGKPQGVATGVLYRDDQGGFHLDSGRSEVYFESGKISEQNDWKNKQVVAGKHWNEDGVLIKELDFPKYYKKYWNNGNSQILMTGLIYRDEQSGFAVDSGHMEIYFENGKVKQQSDWMNKQIIVSKEWNENRMLVLELDSSKSLKKYWDNGKIKVIKTGLLYRDNQGDFSLDSGHSEVYFEIGKIQQKSDWKDKQVFASKEWNENGVLVTELDFPNSAKNYWANGKLKGVLAGLLYRDSLGAFSVDNGHSESYYENGKIEEQNEWRNKQGVAHKKWNENGMLIEELDFPKYYKEYWADGKPKKILTGVLYRDNQGVYRVDSGHSETYYENGKIEEQNEWKNKQGVAHKKWNEYGVLVQEASLPLIQEASSLNYVKSYDDMGRLVEEATGTIELINGNDMELINGHNMVIKDGHYKRYGSEGAFCVVFRNYKVIDYRDGTECNSQTFHRDGQRSGVSKKRWKVDFNVQPSLELNLR